MRETLKHRLVGAAVLTAAAILFLPSFFKEKQAYPVNTHSQINVPPVTQSAEFKAPQPVPNIEPAPAPETMFVPEEVPAETPASVAQSSAHLEAKTATNSSVVSASAPAVASMPLNAKGLPDAWVVQVGSFATKEAANKLRDELQADGHKAYVRSVTTNGNNISRVYIGPKLDKAQAQAIKEQMDKRLKVKAMVMRFQP